MRDIEGWPVPQNDVSLWRDLERGGHRFHVYDGPQTSHWQFWDLWANSGWEPGTLKAVEDNLPPGGLLFDIGAWVGPISLWAAIARQAIVVALEPDRTAYEMLLRNVGHRADCLPYALAPTAGSVRLSTNSAGDSLSSMTRVDMEGPSFVASGIPFAMLTTIYGRPDLVKMDIEGGESLLMGTVGPALRAAGVPLILALHQGWYEPHTTGAMEAELARWRSMEPLGGETYLLRP